MVDFARHLRRSCNCSCLYSSQVLHDRVVEHQNHSPIMVYKLHPLLHGCHLFCDLHLHDQELT